MISLPVRVELQVGVHSDPTCSLTISSVPFLIRPVSGDFILLSKETDEPFALSIHAIAHYDTEDAATLVLTKAIVCDDYDDMLEKLDWFKARYEIEGFRSNEIPEPYYVLYRTVINLLDITDDVPIVIYDPDAIKIFAETCRTVWLSNMISISEKTNGRLPLRSVMEGAMFANQLSDTNSEIETFHRIVFGYRNRNPNGIELLQVIKEWDSVINQDKKYNWDVDDDVCKWVGGFVFSRLKCTTPHFLKDKDDNLR